MKLYSINCRGKITNYDWSIVTIHKTLESAQSDCNIYKENVRKNNIPIEYIIYVIDTDIDSDIVYDYNNLNTEDD